jgi:cytochrome P450
MIDMEEASMSAELSAEPEVMRFPPPPSPIPYDPGPELREAMAKCPVTRVKAPDGSAAWLVTGFNEVREVLADQRYSRALLFAPGRQRYGVDMAAGADTLVALDPPEHSRLRKLVAGAFTARRIRALRPMIAQTVDELIDGMLAGPRPADLVAAFADPLPSRVICMLLDVPMEDADRFRAWSAALGGDWNRPQEEMAAAYAALGGYMTELIARKREALGDDLISVLITARDSGDKLSESELIAFCSLLLTGGYETIAHQLSLSFTALCQRPEQLGRLRADPGLIPGAVEEMLRYVVLFSGGAVLGRMTREEVGLGGVTIPAGETVIPAVGSANRDPATFEDPDRLDVARPPVAHLAFGVGAHHCVGAQLARMELQEAYRGLLARLPGLRVAVPLPEVPFLTGQVVTSVRELPVTWDDA